MAQQTAVEWLFRWLEDNQESTIKEYVKAYEQAKAIEKKQIENAYEMGWINGDWKKAPSRGSDYYDQTFKNEDND